MECNQLDAWLALSLAPGINPSLFRQLLEYFPDLRTLFSGPENNTSPKSRRLSPVLQGFVQNCREHAALKSTQHKIAQSLDWAQQENRQIITWHSDRYPSLLSQIPDAPPVLYVAGSAELPTLPQLAMVGSRKPSPGGRALARSLAVSLAQGGYSICSGMALGIDTESHRGAIESGGSSIAVLGCGIDVVYPKSNRKLAEALLENGSILSEFPLGTAPASWHFPVRNRIISGLSHGVVVIEAALQSGSLITARYALEQGREVFAVPGSVHNPMARGCHLLLKNGAKLVESADDIVDELGAFLQLEHARLNAKPYEGKEKNEDSEENQPPGKRTRDKGPGKTGRRERELLKHLDHDLSTVDDLVRNSGFDAAEISRLLVELELKGCVISRAGGYTLCPPGA